MNCSKCGEPLESGAAFCGNCGQPVEASSSTPSPVDSLRPLTPHSVYHPDGTVVHPTPVTQAQSIVEPTKQIKTATQDNAAPPSQAGLATAALVLGIVDMVAWIVPLFGVPISVVGLVLGIKGRSSDKRVQATIGTVLCAIGLLLSIFSGYLGYTEAINRQKAQSTNATSNTNVLGNAAQSASTNCFSFKLSSDFVVDATLAGCTINAVDVKTGESYTVKPINNASITTADTLVTAARLDLDYIVKNETGSKLESEGATTFKGDPAYMGVIKGSDATDNAVYYILHTTGYVIAGSNVRLFAIVHTAKTSVGNNIDDLNASWSWK